MIDLISQLNIVKLFLFLCKKDIPKSLKFIREQCNKQTFCIKPLLTKRYSVVHEFYIADNLNYPFFAKNRKMIEEYKLLQNLSLSGLNNWEDIKDVMDNKGKIECESYYYCFYFTEKECHNPKENFVILDDHKNIKEE